MAKETYLDLLDQMSPSQKQFVPNGKEQAYRNAASMLKKLKDKHFVVRKVNDEFVVMRIV